MTVSTEQKRWLAAIVGTCGVSFIADLFPPTVGAVMAFLASFVLLFCAVFGDWELPR